MNLNFVEPPKTLAQLETEPFDKISFDIELLRGTPLQALAHADVTITDNRVYVFAGSISVWQGWLFFTDCMGRAFCYRPDQVTRIINKESGQILWQHESFEEYPLITESVS